MEPKQYIVLDDLQYDFMLKLSYPDILNFCSVNKDYDVLCKGERLWRLLIDRDFPMYPSDRPNPRLDYEKLYFFFDKYVIQIIGEFIKHKKGRVVLHRIYDDLFNILVHYIDEYNNIEDDENFAIYHELYRKTYYLIFDTLHIPVDRNMTHKQYHPPKKFVFLQSPAQSKVLFQHLSFIISKMTEDYVDLLYSL